MQASVQRLDAIYGARVCVCVSVCVSVCACLRVCTITGVLLCTKILNEVFSLVHHVCVSVFLFIPTHSLTDYCRALTNSLGGAALAGQRLWVYWYIQSHVSHTVHKHRPHPTTHIRAWTTHEQATTSGM